MRYDFVWFDLAIEELKGQTIIHDVSEVLPIVTGDAS